MRPSPCPASSALSAAAASAAAGFAASRSMLVELKRETGVDRFFKWTGLSVEKQFGHEGFDRLVYIASDDEHMWNRVADSPVLRRAAQALLLDTTADCKVKRVFCANGKLVAHIHRGRIFGRKDDASRLSRHVAATLPLLDGIAKTLRASPRPSLPPRQRAA